MKKAATRMIVKSMAECGYQHDDLEWRHVGFYKYKGEMFAMLLDFSGCSKVADSLKEEAELAMLEGLV